MGQDKLSARMVLCSQTGEVLREYPLNKSEVTIGRASTRDISLPQDRLISRKHASVQYENGDYVLRDVGSANGTLLNGKLIEAMTPYTLSSGDQIHLGRLLFIFQASGDVSSLPTIRRPYTSLDHQWLRLDEAAPAQPPAVQQPAQQPVAMPSIPSTQRQPFMSGPLPAQPSVITGSLLASTGPTAALPAAHLRFTVFYPPDVAANSWYALLIYAHHENAAEAIHKDAALYQEDANEAPRREPMMSSQLL
ncbi:MAG: FHA domain-containing protein, partial [Ktedonobacteraceae bacterium]|nr:FHA domain-containing protein [Ktedonobacteraceae bacterium]